MNDKSYRKLLYDHYVSRRIAPGLSVQTDEASRRWRLAAEVRIGSWLPENRETAILDIGCGSGALLRHLEILKYRRLTSVDVSGEQIELARSLCQYATIIQDDVHSFLQGRASEFDLIIGLDLIEHFAKDEILSLLAGMHNALRPSGRVILQTPNAESPWFGAVAFGDFTHEWFFTPSSLGDLLGLLGFEAYEARASAPVPLGARSYVRAILWRLLSKGLAIWNLVETGSQGSGIYTRVFVATASRSE